MKRQTWSTTLLLICVLFFALPGNVTGATGNKTISATLEPAGPVTSPSVIDYRWSDLAQNTYAQSYVNTYTYGDAVVTVTYETGEPTFVGHLSATGLKPNFAYQIKLVGKPEALFDPVTEGGDDAANERIGYAGRWWEVAPGVGNRDDTYYEAHRNDSAYIFEAYLLFDFFLTDPDGGAEVDFALDSSYHVLFWDGQGTQRECDHPLKTTTVTRSLTDIAYDGDIGATAVGVYPQIERLCNGETALPMGTYSCRLLLTEESFHTTDGNWAPAMINNDIQFNIGAGLFPPAMHAEPAFTAGGQNTVTWHAVIGATEYVTECSEAPDFQTLHDGETVGVASHTFTGLAEGQIYYYRVKASDGAGTESTWSATVSSTQDATAPSSSVDALPASHAGSSLSVPFTASDAISGVDFVQLFVNVDGGAFTRYGGDFASGPINFVIPADGNYGFYTVATDRAGNEEVAAGVADQLCVLTVEAAPAPQGNVDYVDIGFPDSEAGHALVGWGPIEPDTHPGGWGGIGTESPPGKCRTMWSPEEDVPVDRDAEILLDFGTGSGAKSLWLRHLDGGSPDGFDVSIAGEVVTSIPDQGSDETWFWTEVAVNGVDGPQTVRLEATGTQGGLWDPYGQVAIDIITICTSPALFAALPVDSAPIVCGESKQVDFRFTQGCEYIRGYTLRVRSADGLSFDASQVLVHDPSGTGDVTFSVVQNAADDCTITYAINGDSALPAGIPSDALLFAIDFQGTAAGTGQVIIESVAVDPLDQGPPPDLESVGATVAITCGAPTAPGAVTAMAAEPGNREIAVTWQDPPDADLASLEIWRGLWYDADLGRASAYPEYGGLPNDVVPTRPLNQEEAATSPEWELAGTVLPGDETFTDVNGAEGLPRGIYYYEVFAFDTEGLHGPRAAANDPATSYLLGDLDGDGAITLGPDITQGLSQCYGASSGDTEFINECDVGPTEGYSGTGLPLPDDKINFDDLMVMALNFDTVLDKGAADVGQMARFTWTEVATGLWALSLDEACAGLKGLNLRASLPPAAVLEVAASGLLTAQDSPFFLHNIAANGLELGLALLGDGAQIRGAGELLRVTMAAGQTPGEVTVDARDFRNQGIACELATAAGPGAVPVAFRAFANYPNPFNPTTRIDFELPSRTPVELAVFGLDGRHVVTLVERTLPAGRHSVTWAGRDEQGGPVASGAYVYRLRAGAHTKSYKMTLLK